MGVEAAVLAIAVAAVVAEVLAVAVAAVVHQEFLGFPVRQGIVAHKVQLVVLVVKVLLVPKVLRVTRDHVDSKATEEPQAHLEDPGSSVSM